MATIRRIGGARVTIAAPARWAASLLASLLSAEIGAGLFMLVLMAWFALVPRASILLPIRIIASARYGESVLTTLPPTAFLWALALHAGLAALWGLVFGLCATLLRVDKSGWAPLALGVAIGLCAQLVDVDLVGPAVFAHGGAHWLWAEGVPPGLSISAHLSFGLAFAAFPRLFRSFWLEFAGRADILADDPRIS